MSAATPQRAGIDSPGPFPSLVRLVDDGEAVCRPWGLQVASPRRGRPGRRHDNRRRVGLSAV